MSKHISGEVNGKGVRLALVVARFNELVTKELVRGAEQAFARFGGDPEHITVFQVPGSYEIPATTRKVAQSGKFDAIVTLGAVIRGSTPHFDFVAGEAAKGVAQVAFESKIPVLFGVLTTDTIEQAIERAGTKMGNKGADAVVDALEMISLYRKLDGLK